MKAGPSSPHLCTSVEGLLAGTDSPFHPFVGPIWRTNWQFLKTGKADAKLQPNPALETPALDLRQF